MDYLQRITSHQQLQMQEIWSNVQVVEDNCQPRTSYDLRMKEKYSYLRIQKLKRVNYQQSLPFNKDLLLMDQI